MMPAADTALQSPFSADWYAFILVWCIQDLSMETLTAEGVVRRAGDMLRAYRDMREANFMGADKYFHARGNYDAARRGPGGEWAAKVISNAREASQRVTDLFKYGDSGHGVEDSRADQAANEWGRSGKDPNHFRPAGLPDKY
ncbi:PREDICTED: serum amyloid A-2 protein-like [Chrysochloris asiatica]|uniref:Serum amyloid A protein n=1 Tax=Chrysochloris asiatica TaxID=185453 RepID=A0A9B0TSJ7_CHRAS|nr:PREDICTED: serum amyloid A-2 protein-like [Chrysochloris asiatica]